MTADPCFPLRLANALRISRCLAALANATDSWVGKDTKTQNRPELARRQAVGWNAVLARVRLYRTNSELFKVYLPSTLLSQTPS